MVRFGGGISEQHPVDDFGGEERQAERPRDHTLDDSDGERGSRARPAVEAEAFSSVAEAEKRVKRVAAAHRCRSPR